MLICQRALRIRYGRAAAGMRLPFPFDAQTNDADFYALRAHTQTRAMANWYAICKRIAVFSLLFFWNIFVICHFAWWFNSIVVIGGMHTHAHICWASPFISISDAVMSDAGASWFWLIAARIRGCCSSCMGKLISNLGYLAEMNQFNSGNAKASIKWFRESHWEIPWGIYPNHTSFPGFSRLDVTRIGGFFCMRELFSRFRGKNFSPYANPE